MSSHPTYVRYPELNADLYFYNNRPSAPQLLSSSSSSSDDECDDVCDRRVNELLDLVVNGAEKRHYEERNLVGYNLFVVLKAFNRNDDVSVLDFLIKNDITLQGLVNLGLKWSDLVKLGLHMRHMCIRDEARNINGWWSASVLANRMHVQREQLVDDLALTVTDIIVRGIEANDLSRLGFDASYMIEYMNMSFDQFMQLKYTGTEWHLLLQLKAHHLHDVLGVTSHAQVNALMERQCGRWTRREFIDCFNYSLS